MMIAKENLRVDRAASLRTGRRHLTSPVSAPNEDAYDRQLNISTAHRPRGRARAVSGRAPVRPDSPAFSDFDIRPEIVEALADVGIVKTFAIQELTLPVALAGNDLIGQARTGTGKTLGFGVPMLNRLNLPGGDAAAPQALIIAPTRELAVQVSGDLAAAGKKLGARVLTIYGGRAYEPQIDALRKGIDVVVGTPGRLLDLAQQGHLVLGNVRILVLDEADEMLDLGFLPDIEKLMKMLPETRQTMLFSATMPGPIVALARSFLDPAACRSVPRPTSVHTSTDHVDQFAYRAHSMDKVEVLARVLQARNRGLTLIFVRTKRSAAKIADDLGERGFAVAAVHGDLGQGAREQALRAFRSGKVDVLVATDVAARGLDVEGITHVINYQAPEDEMTYVHRIGRTARAGASGTAITLVDWDDIPRWKLICDKLDLPVPRAGRDVLDLAAPLPRTRHPVGGEGRAAARRAHPCRPRRGAARGSRRPATALSAATVRAEPGACPAAREGTHRSHPQPDARGQAGLRRSRCRHDGQLARRSRRRPAPPSSPSPPERREQ